MDIIRSIDNHLRNILGTDCRQFDRCVCRLNFKTKNQFNKFTLKINVIFFFKQGGLVCHRYGGVILLLVCGLLHVLTCAILPPLAFYTPVYVVAISRFVMGVAQAGFFAVHKHFENYNLFISLKKTDFNFN
jgi:hypothetical protein